MKRSPQSPTIRLSRRQFLATTSAAIAVPTFIPASALGLDGTTAPSNRVVMGVVGCGWQGGSNTDSFLRHAACQVVAAADVDRRHLSEMQGKVNKKYGNTDCQGYHDYRELMARRDIDAVMIAVPDHWHALIAVEAARNRKDIYGEKPLARTIVEQQAMVAAVRKHKRIWQTGSWQRSENNFLKGAEIARNGLIGKLLRVEVGLPAGHADFARTKDKTAVTQPPAELDYEFWSGPAQVLPYIEARLHKNWRWNYNTGGGQLLDWIGHHCDIAHWGMGDDAAIGPSEIEGTGEFPPADAVWNTCTKYRINLKYPGDVEMVIAGGHADIRGGTKWIGTEGWVWVNRGGFDASKSQWNEMARLPESERKVSLYKSTDHYLNFLECVKSRQPAITPVEVAHHSAIPGHLGLISMMVGRKLRWDAKKEKIANDPGATALLGREYRKPWKLG